jgi:hypothetical protein
VFPKKSNPERFDPKCWPNLNLPIHGIETTTSAERKRYAAGETSAVIEQLVKGSTGLSLLLIEKC